MKAADLIELLSEGRRQRKLILPHKGWIMPDGKVVDCRRVWHYEWLRANTVWLRKNYGIKLVHTEEGETPLRLEAMRAGMFRVGSDDRRMIVQGIRAKFVRQVKDTVLELAWDNADSLDSVFVSLLRPGGEVAAEKEAAVSEVPFCESRVTPLRKVERVVHILLEST